MPRWRLQQYLDTSLPTARVMVVGDWNDDLDRSIVKDPNTGQYLETPFKNFLDAPAAYSFTTLPLAATERSTVSYSSFIDHQLTSNELAEDFVPNSAYVLKPALTNYGITTSDHYPVISRFDFGHLPPPPPPPHRMELRLTSPNGGESFPASTVQNHLDVGRWHLRAARVLRGRRLHVAGAGQCPRGAPGGTPSPAHRVPLPRSGCA
jgi:hypothetical protein